MDYFTYTSMKILEFHRDGIFPTDSSPFKMYQVPHTPAVTSHILLVLVCVAQNGFLDGIFVCAKLVFFGWNIIEKSTPKTFAKGGYAPPPQQRTTSHNTQHNASSSTMAIEPWPPPLPVAISLTPQLQPFQNLGR